MLELEVFAITNWPKSVRDIRCSAHSTASVKRKYCNSRREVTAVSQCQSEQYIGTLAMLTGSKTQSKPDTG